MNLSYENNFSKGIGLIGIYDAENKYRRIGDYSSYGLGLHDIAILPEGYTLVIANGGKLTLPDEGR
jgi:hypothetical protein